MNKTVTYMKVVTFGMFGPAVSPQSFLSVLNQSAEGREMLQLFNASAWT